MEEPRQTISRTSSSYVICLPRAAVHCSLLGFGLVLATSVVSIFFLLDRTKENLAMHELTAKIVRRESQTERICAQESNQTGEKREVRRAYFTNGSKLNDLQEIARYKEEERLRYHSLVADQLNAANIDKTLKYMSSEEHVAGTKQNQLRAKWIHTKLKSYGFDAVINKKYRVLLSYPAAPGRISVLDHNDKEIEKMTIREEKHVREFARKKEKESKMLPPYLAYSSSGVVEGELIYANYGNEKDFADLKKSHISVEGKIVLMRYGDLSRTEKVKLAEINGATGVLLYPDPKEYSPTGVVFPDSWHLPGDGTPRGTLLRARGDPATKGYPAIDGLYSLPASEVKDLPTIPAQSLGFSQAEKLLRYLDGRSAIDQSWHGGLNVSYSIDSRTHRKVRLFVNVTREKRTITDVVGVIRGDEEPDRAVLVGNHRDSWAYGASDPSSGTAVQVEIARALGWLRKKGWRPRRTIMLCSWDAEEFGLIGSTEWAKEHAKMLTHTAVAYLNMDSAVQGNGSLDLKSTPALMDVFFDAAKLFKDPNTNESLYDSWIKVGSKKPVREPEVRYLGGGSDYVPFYVELGIPSMDVSYQFETANGFFNFPMYHSKYDSYLWIKKFIDPDMRYHTTFAKLMTQVILQLADSVLLPFNLARYVESIHEEVSAVTKAIDLKGLGKLIDYSLLTKATTSLQKAAQNFHARLREIDKTDPLAVRIANDQMSLFERTFVTTEDLPSQGKTRHTFHSTSLLLGALKHINRKRPEDMAEYLTKFSVFTYHLLMAIQALQNPFTYISDGPRSGTVDSRRHRIK